MSSKYDLTVVLPCRDEKNTVGKCVQKLKDAFNAYNIVAEIIVVDNASSDNTRPLLREICKRNKHVKAILNAKNFGQFNSPYYGMLQTTGDCVISMVCDFQDPIEMIPKYLAEWENGYKIVIGIKTSSQENKLMYALRSMYYSFVKKFSDVESVRCTRRMAESWEALPIAPSNGAPFSCMVPSVMCTAGIMARVHVSEFIGVAIQD